MKVVAIGDEHFTEGFSLAGVTESYVHKDGQSTLKQLRKFMNSGNVAVVLISEKVAESVRAELNRMTESKDLYPVIVEIPDREGPAKDKEDPLEEKIKRAVGIDISLKEDS
ncbi:MAG: V-type ATP synthase subunit F [Thermoplasmata archaeon]